MCKENIIGIKGNVKNKLINNIFINIISLYHIIINIIWVNFVIINYQNLWGFAKINLLKKIQRFFRLYEKSKDKECESHVNSPKTSNIVLVINFCNKKLGILKFQKFLISLELKLNTTFYLINKCFSLLLNKAQIILKY